MLDRVMVYSYVMSGNIEVIDTGSVTSPKGFLAGATYAGIKTKTKDVLDLAILYSEATCSAAAVFTTNKIQAAPVIIDRKKISETGQARGIIVNSGCANACTGEQGMQDVETTAKLAAQNLGVSAAEMLVASTGVIGVPLPMDKIKSGLSRIVLTGNDGHNFTRAIMTTDTRPKEIAVKVKSEPADFIIGGTAKGAGMIHPNMATMLGFITTDAAVDREFLQSCLQETVDASFNLVTVDGDTSTNDTVILLANGLARNGLINSNSSQAADFKKALEQVCVYLAKSIAHDGEGATRLIEVIVNGAHTLSDARIAARTIASSPLVKTAVHGCDPNWGRIIAAAGRSGARLNQDRADVYIGDMCLLKAGRPLTFDKKAATNILNCQEVSLRVDFNLGDFCATAWGCDLSEEYVVINSEYTT
jgi:glutamate N-acetyltransferase / amino-acid N-acetyltransferase